MQIAFVNKSSSLSGLRSGGVRSPLGSFYVIVTQQECLLIELTSEQTSSRFIPSTVALCPPCYLEVPAPSPGWGPVRTKTQGINSCTKTKKQNQRDKDIVTALTMLLVNDRLICNT